MSQLIDKVIDMTYVNNDIGNGSTCQVIIRADVDNPLL